MDFLERSRYITNKSFCDRLKIIRSGADWLTIFYSIYVSKSVYSRLNDNVEWRIGKEIVYLRSRVSQGSTILSGDGLWIRFLNPDFKDDKDPQGFKSYPIEIQFQGRSWAAGLDLDDSVQSFEDWIEIMPTNEQRIPGRIDLCSDIWIRESSDLSSIDVYKTIVCDGSVSLMRRNWSTSSFKRDQWDKVRALSKSSITMYWGSRSSLQLRIYEKSADFQGNTKDLLLETWEKNGYDGSGIVCRVEFSISRDLIRHSDFYLQGGFIVSGKNIRFIHLRGILRDLWLTCFSRFRHVPEIPGLPSQPRNRANSIFWDFVSLNSPDMWDRGSEICFTTSKRFFDVESLKKKLHMALLI